MLNHVFGSGRGPELFWGRYDLESSARGLQTDPTKPCREVWSSGSSFARSWSAGLVSCWVAGLFFVQPALQDEPPVLVVVGVKFGRTWVEIRPNNFRLYGFQVPRHCGLTSTSSCCRTEPDSGMLRKLVSWGSLLGRRSPGYEPDCYTAPFCSLWFSRAF